MALQRGGWEEIVLDEDPEALVMVHPGWTSNADTLILALRETGWFPTTGQAVWAAETAQLKWVWIGVTDQSTVVICSAEGIAIRSGEEVVDVSAVTLARISNPA
jgi:hypothetical protein